MKWLPCTSLQLSRRIWAHASCFHFSSSGCVAEIYVWLSWSTRWCQGQCPEKGPPWMASKVHLLLKTALSPLSWGRPHMTCTTRMWRLSFHTSRCCAQKPFVLPTMIPFLQTFHDLLQCHHCSVHVCEFLLLKVKYRQFTNLELMCRYSGLQCDSFEVD